MKREFEEILEAIWTCEEKQSSSTEDVARACHVRMDSGVLEEMQRERLIASDANSIYLTGSGRKRARGLIRRKRLAEELLEHVLNIRGDKADKIACEFEHGVIREVEESICILLGHPVECQHGNRIPPGPCCRARKNNIDGIVDQVSNFKVGEKIKISYIRPESHHRLHKLISLGLTPGTIIEIHQTRPAFVIKYDNTEIAMDRKIAGNIYGWRSKS